jgi:hypothetical protein
MAEATRLPNFEDLPSVEEDVTPMCTCCNPPNPLMPPESVGGPWECALGGDTYMVDEALGTVSPYSAPTPPPAATERPRNPRGSRANARDAFPDRTNASTGRKVEVDQDFA